jgi:hypothetical protein
MLGELAEPGSWHVEHHQCGLAMTDDGPRITKLPPGVAPGAGDLHRWASRRLAGWSGTPERSSRCRSCGGQGRIEQRKHGGRRMWCSTCRRTWKATT